MDNVVKLPGAEIVARVPEQTIIDRLEEMLAKAKRGEVTSIAFACVLDRQYVATFYHRGEGDHFGLLTGAVALVNHRVVAGFEKGE